MSQSKMFKKITQPLANLNLRKKSYRNCPKISNELFLELGILRVLGNEKSGRAFMQKMMIGDIADLDISHYFKSLASKRRLSYIQDVEQQLIDECNNILLDGDPFAQFPELAKFDIYASDGSYHEWACHDERFEKKKAKDAPEDRGDAHKKTKRSCQHFYSCDLRSQMSRHLTVAEIGVAINKKKEHDIHALKRISPEALKLNAKKGQKVLHVYDKACIDFHQWFKWKNNNGIYILTREKTSSKLNTLSIIPFEENDSVNIGVTHDETVTQGNGYLFRRVTYVCPKTKKTFTFLTTLSHDIRPGIIVALYKARWDIEKQFDVFKNKLEEKKAWASSDTAKTMQAMFLCITYNLALLLNKRIKEEEGLVYKHDLKKKLKMVLNDQKKLNDAGVPYPSTWESCLRVSQITIIFYRWIRAFVDDTRSWDVAIVKLERSYNRN